MTLEELQKQNDTLSARLEKAKSVFKEQAAKIKELEEKAAGAVSIASDDGEKDALKAEAESLKSKLSAAEAKAGETEAELEKTKSEMEKMKSEAEKMKSDSAAEYSALNERFENACKEYKASEAKRSEAEAKAAAAISMSTDASKALNEKLEEMSKLQDAVKKLEREKAAVSADAAQLKAQLESLQKDASDSADWKKKYELRAEAITKANQDVKAMTAAYSQANADLKRVVNEHEQKAIAWDRERAALNERVKELGLKLQDADSMMKAMSSSTDAAKAFFAKVQAAYAECVRA